MAVDKLVDSAKLDACCTAEANAIRAKSGGSAAISYDWANSKGFADAIAVIPSGGNQKIADWKRPSYMPDISPYVIEKENTYYVSVYNKESFHESTSSRILGPVLSSLKVIVFHDDGTTTTQDIDLSSDPGFLNGGYVRARILPVGKLLLIGTASSGITTVPRADNGEFWLYEIYCFGDGVHGTERCTFAANNNYQVARVYLKNLKFIGSVTLGALITGEYAQSLKEARFEDCDFSSITSLNQFTTQSNNAIVELGRFNISPACTQLQYAFSEYSGETLDLSECDFTGATVTTGMFRQYQRNNAQLMNLDIGKAPLISFDISALVNLTKQSLVNVIASLQQVQTTQTLTMGSTLSSKLTAEEISIATAKGWTVA